MDNEQFWMVWNPAGCTPKYKHPDRGAAITEAERLARMNPGHQFYVLGATDMRCVDGMQRLELAPWEPPF